MAADLSPPTQQEPTGPFIELDDPTAECPNCHHQGRIAGRWSVEYGSLVFRADPDPLPNRGPSLTGCSEGDGCPGQYGKPQFAGLRTADEDITGGDFSDLIAVAENLGPS